jgi:hypothetical protein
LPDRPGRRQDPVFGGTPILAADVQRNLNDIAMHRSGSLPFISKKRQYTSQLNAGMIVREKQCAVCLSLIDYAAAFQALRHALRADPQP